MQNIFHKFYLETKVLINILAETKFSQNLIRRFTSNLSFIIFTKTSACQASG